MNTAPNPQGSTQAASTAASSDTNSSIIAFTSKEHSLGQNLGLFGKPVTDCNLFITDPETVDALCRLIGHLSERYKLDANGSAKTPRCLLHIHSLAEDVSTDLKARKHT